jgi:hypothetical protein
MEGRAQGLNLLMIDNLGLIIDDGQSPQTWNE